MSQSNNNNNNSASLKSASKVTLKVNKFTKAIVADDSDSDDVVITKPVSKQLENKIRLKKVAKPGPFSEVSSS